MKYNSSNIAHAQVKKTTEKYKKSVDKGNTVKQSTYIIPHFILKCNYITLLSVVVVVVVL